MSKDDKILKEFTSKEYEHGWSINFDVDQAPSGLNEDIIKLMQYYSFYCPLHCNVKIQKVYCLNNGNDFLTI